MMEAKWTFTRILGLTCCLAFLTAVSMAQSDGAALQTRTAVVKVQAADGTLIADAVVTYRGIGGEQLVATPQGDGTYLIPNAAQKLSLHIEHPSMRPTDLDTLLTELNSTVLVYVRDGAADSKVFSTPAPAGPSLGLATLGTAGGGQAQQILPTPIPGGPSLGLATLGTAGAQRSASAKTGEDDGPAAWSNVAPTPDYSTRPSFGTSVPDKGPKAGASCPVSNCDNDTLTQSFDLKTDSANQVACGVAGLGTTENSWARCFDLAAEGFGGAVTINSVTFGVQQATIDDIPINVNLYVDSDGCPPPGSGPDDPTLTLVGSASTLVGPADEGTFITLAFPAIEVAAGSVLIVDIEAPQDGTVPPEHFFRAMSNDVGACGSSYLRAAACGIPGWIAMEDIGFPDAHLVLSIDATAAECAGGGGETCENCPEDCCPVECGDGVCDGDETCENCPADCDECPGECGDGVCDVGAGDCPASSCDAGTISHSQSLDIVSGVGIACGAGGNTTENAWARCFNLADEGYLGDVIITSVDFGYETAPPVGVDVPVFANIYITTLGCPATGFGTPDTVLVGTAETVMTSGDAEVLLNAEFAVPVEIAAGSTIIVEFENVLDGTDPNGPNFGMWPGANALGQCGAGSIRSVSCGIADWITLAAIGFPDSHLTIQANGSSEECGGGGGETCENCPQDCCPGGTGACCLSGNCADGVTQAECENDNGDYQGDGTTCGGGSGEAVSTPGLPISSDLPPTVDTLDFPDDIAIQDVDIDVIIDHTWVADLFITVEHLGTTVVLWNSACGSNDNMDVIFDDEGDPVACASPTTGNITPASAGGGSLSDFDGLSSAGLWTISVTDQAGGDDGTLIQWSVHVSGGDSPCDGGGLGACCIDGDCADDFSEGDCAAAGGEFQGDGTSCGGGGGGDGQEHTSNPNVAIPDNTPGGVSDTINVPGDETIEDIDIDLVIDHTWVGDLCVTVEHNGTSVIIIQRMGDNTGLVCDGGCCGCSEDNLDILLDDGGGPPINDQCVANLSGTFDPQNPLSAFNGMGKGGDWTITVNDNAGADTGTLISWSLHINGSGGGGGIDCGPAGADGDECEDCIEVGEGNFSGTTADNTGSTGDDTSCIFGDEIDEWYCYTASCTGTATASLCGSGFDTGLAVFDGCGGAEIVCNDDACGLQSEVSWATTAGQVYNVRVSGFNNSTGDYTLDLSIVCEEGCGDGVCDDGGSSDCCTPGGNGTPGCDDPDCQALICGQDPFCCNDTWDVLCANAAIAQCEICIGEDCVSCPADCGECPICECPPGAGDEAEACGEDTNGGCNQPPGDPPVFFEAECNMSYCGTVWASGAMRDTDWYRVVVAGGTITSTVTSGSPTTNFILTIPCPAALIGTTGCSDDCAPIADASADVGPGEFVVFVATGDCAGGGIFDGDPCGGPTEYVVEITCEQGGCEDDEDCAGDLLCVNGVCVPPPAENDDCADALPGSCGDTLFTTLDATTDGPAHAECQFDGQTYQDIWYEFIAPTGGNLTVSTCDLVDYDSDLVVYDGCDCGALNFLGCNDDGIGCGGFSSEVTVPVVGGNCYLVRVGGFQDGDVGTGTLRLSGPPCEIPVGACCFGADCVDNLSDEDCTAQGGEWQGADTTCTEPGETIVVESTPGLPLSSGLPAAVDTINMGMDFQLQDVDIDVVITHTWIGDLFMTVEHAGTTVVLWDNACGNTDDMNVLFDDEGGAVNCVSPVTGNITPASAFGGALSAFDGLSSAGAWTITVEDQVGGDDGTLVQWSIHLTPPGDGESICGCGGPEDCSDGDPCTDDVCGEDGECSNPLVDCGDLDDDCNVGVCVDGNCVADPINEGGACGDQSESDCDAANTCSGGVCQDNNEDAGTSCTDDGNDCTDDVCDGSGSCTHPNEDAGTGCGDQSSGDCDNPDSCDGNGNCQDNNADAGTACTDDGNGCTDDECDGSGSCAHPNNTDPCDDGDACTTNDTCSSGSCEGGAPLDCDDNNGCTADSCDPATGCVNEDIEQTLIIKQGACPAPVNPNSNGVMPMLLVGRDGFNVNNINLDSLDLHRCDGVGGSATPLAEHTKVKDLNHPGGSVACGECQCNDDQSSDGVDDLSLKFRTSTTLAALMLGVGDGVVTLEITGEMMDGTPFCARDCVIIVPPGTGSSNIAMESSVFDTFVEVEPLDLNIDSDGFSSFSRAYLEGTVVTINAPMLANGRRFLRWSVDGVMQPFGLRTIEVTATAEDIALMAIYERPNRLEDDRPEEGDGDLE